MDPVTLALAKSWADGEFGGLRPLIPNVGGIEDLLALHPHIASILDSRIVKMGSNSNGTYVRWENGLQVCYADLVSSPASQHWEYIDGSQLGITRSWTLPASFVGNTLQCVSPDFNWGFSIPFRNKLSAAYVSSSDSVRNIRIRFTQAVTVNFDGNFGADVFVIGRWK